MSKPTGRKASATRAVGPGGQSRTIPERVARHVWVTAGGRCTICNRYLADEEHTGQDVPVGQLAHIVGWSTAAGSPRGDANLPPDQRNTPENLMLLCHDQHHVVDSPGLWDTYDAETLRRLKRVHEHQIKALTALRESNRTTVLRVVSTLHGKAVEVSRKSINKALLARDKFPDWTLLNGADEFEVDLRRLPGEVESTAEFWTMARAQLMHQLASLRNHVHREAVDSVSVFAVARIPILVLLGTMLDETVKTELYPKRRDGVESWGWDDTAETTDFVYTAKRTGTITSKVAVVFSVSGSIDFDRLPAEFDETYTVYELRPAGLPVVELIKTQRCLDDFSQCWRHLLSTIEADHPGASDIAIFPAVPATAAVSIGRHVMHAAHPPLRIYDRLRDGTYRYAITTRSADDRTPE
ncbi:SAVED domain-containing protein [Lentzea sp. NPDC051838]|uniref:SAVED domain-containing protein n=1 Tax=Lentzea sp. NPDC051838 TaxID=3154849 RepID=UPI00342557D0